MSKNKVFDNNYEELQAGDICFFWSDAPLEELVDNQESYSCGVGVFFLSKHSKYVTKTDYVFDYCVKLQ